MSVKSTALKGTKLLFLILALLFFSALSLGFGVASVTGPAIGCAALAVLILCLLIWTILRNNCTADMDLQALPFSIAFSKMKEVDPIMRTGYSIMQAKRDFEIMTESYNLANTTLNLDTFLTRYDLALKKAITLLQAERVKIFSMRSLNCDCNKACRMIIDAYTNTCKRALHNCTEHAIQEAEALKTNKGKQNRYVKLFQTLTNAEIYFSEIEEYHIILDTVNTRISDLAPTGSKN